MDSHPIALDTRKLKSQLTRLRRVAAAARQEARVLAGALPGLVWRPNQTFTALYTRRGKAWMGMALLVLALSIMPAAAAGFFKPHEAAPPAPVQIPRGQDLVPSMETQAELAPAAEPMTPLDRLARSCWAAVAPLCGWLAWTGFLYAGALLMGGRGQPGRLFEMVVWAWLPFGLRGLLQTIYILIMREPLAAPGLAGFVEGSGAAEALAAHLLAQVQIYTFWTLALLAAGARVFTRLPARKAIRLVSAGALLGLILTALPALAASFFQSILSGPAGGY
jgi:hypothetical protein